MSRNKLITATLSTAFVATLVTPLASATENPFALSDLSSGYQVADGHHGAHAMGDKCDMKSGEGKCGMAMADADKDGKVSKAEATKMHESMFTKADANQDGFVDKDEMVKMREGKCGGMKAMEGKCGEGKCGAGMKK